MTFREHQQAMKSYSQRSRQEEGQQRLIVYSPRDKTAFIECWGCFSNYDAKFNAPEQKA